MCNTQLSRWCILACVVLMLVSSCREPRSSQPEASEAGLALDQWFAQRMNAEGQIPIDRWMAAYRTKQAAAWRSGDVPTWESIGPHNIGGRTLCLAFHPDDPNTVFAGSASGGLWRTTSNGEGEMAWERIPLDHPVLGVSAIVIDRENPDRMWIGTGEMYSNGVVGPGTINRFTRGTYGIGILRSLDGGQTWTPSLDWSYGDMRGIQHLAQHPQNPEILYAATSQGLYRTIDGGDSWARILDVLMAVDLYIHPSHPDTILVSTGSFYTPQSGIYRSTDGGSSFVQIMEELPFGFSGKAQFGPDPMHPDTIYVSIANAVEGLGLYRSTDAGATWSLVNAQNIPQYQGWYSHDVAVSPNDPNLLLYAGIDVHRSTDQGSLFIQTSVWQEWLFGKVPIGGPEGPPYYVHADIHQVQYHPARPNEVWLATDGGIFVTEDEGINFSGRNGGYQTQQFYANFSSSAQDPDLAIGGMQDNATAIYEGDKAWVRVLGGDGLSTAIDPSDDHRILGSAQFLFLFRSTDRGESFETAVGESFQNEAKPFNGAFSLVPQDPDMVYAGAERLHRSDTFGLASSWYAVGDDPVDPGRIINLIAVSPQNPQHLVVQTVSDPIESGGINQGGVFVSTNGGQSWDTATGLPDRYATDLVFHPVSGDTLLATYSGFTGNPVFRSIDGGWSWQAWGTGLPDIPTNCLVFDPFRPRDLYVGNDLGVYYSADGGANWSPFDNGLPGATMVLDLSVSLPKKTVRAATHGLGAFEAPLFSQSVAVSTPGSRPRGWQVDNVWPNPVVDQCRVAFSSDMTRMLAVQIKDTQGREWLHRTIRVGPEGHTLTWDLPADAPSGAFILIVTDEMGQVHTENLVRVGP